MTPVSDGVPSSDRRGPCCACSAQATARDPSGDTFAPRAMGGESPSATARRGQCPLRPTLSPPLRESRLFQPQNHSPERESAGNHTHVLDPGGRSADPFFYHRLVANGSAASVAVQVKMESHVGGRTGFWESSTPEFERPWGHQRETRIEKPIRMGCMREARSDENPSHRLRSDANRRALSSLREGGPWRAPH